MIDDGGRIRLFTPGPLSTSSTVRAAMAQDLGSRTSAFIELTRQVRAEIEAVAECGPEYTAVPVQGSGTFAVEAMLSSLVGEDDHVLVVENGLYSRRMAEICRIHRIRHTVLALDHHRGIDPSDVGRFMADRGPFSYLAMVHFETGLGVLNDLDWMLRVAAQQRCRVLLDGVSSLGAVPVDFSSGTIAAVAISANKCLHGVPGVAFVVASKHELRRPGPARTLSLDLRSQWQELDRTGEWRFTPPIQVMLALRQAIREFHAEGGRAARYRRYQALSQHLIEGLARLGITPVIDERWRAPMIATFAFAPEHQVAFADLHERLLERKLVIYPSKYPAPSFRVGCIGELQPADIDDLLAALREQIGVAARARDAALLHAGDHLS